MLNHVKTLATFDGLDNVLGGSGPGCDVPSAVASLASFYSRTTRIYLDVFRNCSEFCGIKLQGECVRAFRVINRAEDAQLYFDVYQKYSRVSGKVPCVQQDTGVRGSSPFIGGVRDTLDKRKLQPSGLSDAFGAYLALCLSGVGLRRSRISSLCGSSASLHGRSSHANTNAVMITGDSQNSSHVSRRVNHNGCSTSRRGRNVQVRPRLNSEVAMRSTSRRNDRRVLTSGGTVDTNSVATAVYVYMVFVGTSYTYSDLGDCDCRCCYCGASLWYVKRLKGHSHNRTPEYSLCCKGGRMQMQRPREPPEYIKSLFENKHFVENIRAYNQMFAMTSFGAKVDESINAGRGPYVFKVSGQIYHWIGSLCLPAGERPRFLQLYIYDTDNEVQNMMDHFGGIDNSQLQPGIVEGLIHFLYAHNELVQLFRTTRDKCRELEIPKFKIRLYNAEGLGAGYHTELTLKSANGVDKGKRVTMLAYYRYQLHFRLQQYNLLFKGGGPRYMYARYLDALAICRKLGNPQFFITFTCNVSWPKIKRFMSEYPHLTASDRADVVCRVFEQKIQALIAFLKEECIFGDCSIQLNSKKRGLLHCHTLLWVDSASRIRIVEDVDRFVSAELPDPSTDPEGYNVVSGLIMHVPTELLASKLSRRDTGISVTRNEFQMDNSYVVPYNRDLLLAFRAHINVEYCGWSLLIKYLFTYISKGTDRVFARVYRILKFDIHHREPAVQILAVHLEDMQRITFRDEDRLESVIDLPEKKSTTLTEWFAFNEANEVERNLSYLEFSSEFVWYSNRKCWSSRKNNKSSIGLLSYVHPTSGELFFLRMLLCHQKGCRDFWEVQNVNGVFYLTYRAACQAFGLLGYDKE
uniref:DNA helicase n=1 Tax=Tanacetum cinerariifolium TaxID=118510 RepID=A0A699GMY6_TANCI|nr:DNA helicase [Tanacetum cinerariifolium]